MLAASRELVRKADCAANRGSFLLCGERCRRSVFLTKGLPVECPPEIAYRRGNGQMLTVVELAGWCESLNLSAEARAVIETIRSSPPARRVRSAAGNVSVRYPSRKMGVTIQAESHRVELAGLYEYEHDHKALEFYDQPPPIKLVYAAKNGRQVAVWHTPDYFVLRTDAGGWEEWKIPHCDTSPPSAR